jgi:hypothetical protein
VPSPFSLLFALLSFLFALLWKRRSRNTSPARMAMPDFFWPTLNTPDIDTQRFRPSFSLITEATPIRVMRMARRMHTCASGDPVVDNQTSDVAAEQGTVIGDQRGPQFQRGGRDHEIEIRLQPSSRSELRLDHTEPVSD